MKLVDFLLNGHMNGLRAEMGAPLSRSYRTHQPYKIIELPVVERLRDGGVDVDLDEVKRLPDGTMEYRGYRVLLYIRDIANYGGHESLPKYHLSYCATLERMQRDRRFARYVVANRDDGTFLVNLMSSQDNRARLLPLSVCQFCLGNLNWKGFTSLVSREDRLDAVGAFSLPEFFATYPKDLVAVLPPHTSDTSPLNDYTLDWGDVSERTKRVRNYTCEGCDRRLTLRAARYLHVHHRNGLKHDNSDDNLEVLCIACHANEPHHGHMKSHRDYAEFLQLWPAPPPSM